MKSISFPISSVPVAADLDTSKALPAAPSVSFMRHLSLIAAREFGDRFRSGWVIVCILVWLGAVGLTSFFGLLQIGRIGMQGYERTVLSLLNLVQYLVPLLALLLGHDLLVSEREDRTLRFLLSCGLTRSRLLLGKYLGGCFTLAVPLLLGFAIAGAAIGLSARDTALIPFIRLGLSGLLLGTIFLALGLAISAFSRTRVQSLVAALLVWCLAVFVFDLVALGWLVSSKASVAAQEIDLICDTTHINSAATADIHSAFDENSPASSPSVKSSFASPVRWLAANPVDLFRAINLSQQTGYSVSCPVVLLISTLWLGCSLAAAYWQLRRTDL